MFKQTIFFGSILFFTSCGGWSDTDKANFIERCEKAKFNYDYCECALDKATENYSSFDESIFDEVEFGKLAIDCIEKDRITEEQE